jgi:hypothetical protein
MLRETIFSTVSIIDRYLCKAPPVRRSKYQLVGVTALLIAAKCQEIEEPTTRELSYMTNTAYSQDEIVKMEATISTTLDFKFLVPTVYTFLPRYLAASRTDSQVENIVFYLAERSLQEYSMLKYPPSMIAASAILISRKSSALPPWSATLLKYTKYDVPDLCDCCNEFESIIKEPDQANKAVFNKYSKLRFNHVATHPLVF